MEDAIKTLLDLYGKDDQRTNEWHNKRGQMLTASEIYKTVNGASEASRRELIMSKLLPRKEYSGFGPKALLWGTRFEPIAKDIYCELKEVDIVDTSCVPHPVHSFLGASPDGIITTPGEMLGNLVEFKCPISRNFDDTTPIPPQYYHQMQLQMECTQLKICDYIEIKFKEVNYSEWIDSDSKYKSAYAVSETGEVIYRDYAETSPISVWREKYLDSSKEWSILYWIYIKHRTTLVPLDQEWLTANLPHFQATWADVETHRLNGTFPEDPREKATLVM